MTLRRSAIAVAAALALGATACSDPAPSPEAPPSAPTQGADQPAPAPEAGDILWQTRDYPDPLNGVEKIGDGYVVTTSGATIRLDLDGGQQWVVREPPSRRNLSQAVITGDVVVRHSRGESPDDPARIRVLDGRSGRLLWQDGLDEVIMTARSIVTGTCTGESGAGVPEGCTVTARAPASGRVQWRASTSAGLGSLDVVGATVVVTSYPYGTDRSVDPYGERTVVQVLDARTGERRGPDLLGNGFRTVGRVLIEDSYSGSVGNDCEGTLVARLLDGRELWSRSFNWSLTQQDQERDWDCALALEMDPLDGGRVEVTSRNRFGQVLDATSGRTLWDYGGRRLVLDSFRGVDVVTDYDFRRVQGLDARTHRKLWEARGELSYDEAPTGYVAFTEDPGDTTKELTLRSIRTGEVSLRVADTSYVMASGADWAAVSIEGDGGGRIALVHWPH